MCHLILFLPVLALPVFWLLPPGLSVPTYAVALILSAGIYWLAIRALHRPVTCGSEALIRRQGTVIQAGPDPRIQIGAEIWRAKADKALPVGAKVEIVGRDELVLLVRPVSREGAHA